MSTLTPPQNTPPYSSRDRVEIIKKDTYEYQGHIIKYGKKFGILKGATVGSGAYNTLRKISTLNPEEITAFRKNDLPSIETFLKRWNFQYNEVYRKFHFSVDFINYDQYDQDEFFRTHDYECQCLRREDEILTYLEQSPFQEYFPKTYSHGFGIDSNISKNPALLVTRYFLFMEYCPHGTLFNRILKHPLTPKEIISYIHQIIHILKILHTELHIIHRDLNLANFLIGKNNQIKLTDFGFSVKMSEVKEEIIGPAYYMPPESQEPTEPSDKWDIYSLGILLFEMMQHVRPALPLPKTDEFFLMLQDVVKERYDGTLTKRFYCYGRTYEDVKPEEPFLLLIWNMLQPSPTNRPSILDVKQRLEGLFGIPPTTTRSVSGGGPSK